ncbi:MAG: ECF RNA polymerase sigma factor SigK [Ignavibacteria bacterium]|nr:ECF RNA polymerase sigma factor SigK [Ignavibacteria bacterium]
MTEPDVNTDLLLLEKISEKDTNALSKFYDIHSRHIFSLIFYILKNESEAEDVLQEVFIQIWDKVNTYDKSLGSPISWIVKIARNKAIDRLRSKSFKKRTGETDIERFYDIADDSDNPEKHADSKKHRAEIADALKELKDDQKELIEFAYFRGYSQSELAEHFKIPLGTVKTRMRTAMMILRNKLKHLI